LIIYPAIDLKEGNCVRLLQGRMDSATVYANQPEQMALRWQQAGGQWLHVVDLDGAFDGTAANAKAISAIVQAVDIPVQVGGGIRTLEQMAYYLEQVGVTRVILGTIAVEQPQLVQDAVTRFGAQHIAVGIDARDGWVAVRGWAEQSQVSALDLAQRVRAMGVEHIVYTDISRDGMMQGPNFDATFALQQQSGAQVILSGGISCMEDILQTALMGISGCIVGKALYTGAVDLAQALREVAVC